MEDQEQEETGGDWGFGEVVNNQSSNKSEEKSREKCIDPWTEGCITSGPLGCKPSSHYLKWEIDKNYKSHIFAFKSFFDHF